MGAHRRQIILKVLVPEALPALVSGFTITVVSLIGASAMAGAVGGGGLGDLAIRYGYQRFDTTVMVAVIVVLIVLVSGLPFAGDRLAVRLKTRACDTRVFHPRSPSKDVDLTKPYLLPCPSPPSLLHVALALATVVAPRHGQAHP